MQAQTHTPIQILAPSKAQTLCDEFLTARERRARARQEYARQEDTAKDRYTRLLALPKGELTRICESVAGAPVEWLADASEALTGRRPDTTDPAWLVNRIICARETGLLF